MPTDLVIQSTKRGSTVGTLPTGDAGVAATVASMQAVIDHAVYHDRYAATRLRALAEKIAASTDSASPQEFGAALYRWAAENTRFDRDPPATEMIRTPATMIRVLDTGAPAFGDCDDLTCLLCSIIAAGGLRPVIITVAIKRGGRFKHVFPGIYVSSLSREGVYPIDPQRESADAYVTPAGKYPPVRRVKFWALSPSPAK